MVDMYWPATVPIRMDPEQIVLAKHGAIVDAAAAGYCEYLRRELRQSPSTALHAVISSLLKMFERARAHGTQLQISESEFSLREVEQLAIHERVQLLNQYELGLGRDDAPILVVGTEHAYELGRVHDLPNFTLESCANQVLWLCGGSPDIVRALTAGRVRPASGRPHHIYPNDFTWKVGLTRGHGWLALSVLALSIAREPPRTG